jgi:nicotinamidase-related amidase
MPKFVDWRGHRGLQLNTVDCSQVTRLRQDYGEASRDSLWREGGDDVFDNAHRRHTGFTHYLEKRGINDIYLMGLALDYCVKYSTLDARHLGLTTHVIVDGCRGIELEPGDIDRALDEMKRAGAVLLQSSELSVTRSGGL